MSSNRHTSVPLSTSSVELDPVGMNQLTGVWGEGWRMSANVWNQTAGRVPGVPKFQTPRELRNLPHSVQHAMIASQFVRYAGVSGAVAVVLGAYGAHKLLIDPKLDAKVKQAFENGNRYHLIHSVALALTPFSQRPKLTGACGLNFTV